MVEKVIVENAPPIDMIDAVTAAPVVKGTEGDADSDGNRGPPATANTYNSFTDDKNEQDDDAENDNFLPLQSLIERFPFLEQKRYRM